MRTLTYRLDHDLGFAPNPFFGWCSLACCMPLLRKHVKLGDLIVGLAGSGNLRSIHPQLIYWMQVEECMSFDQYWQDPRFIHKKPKIPSFKMEMVGDNTYRTDPKSKEWIFDTSMHFIAGAVQKNGGHVKVDTGVDRVLVSQSFTYWGKSGPIVPNHLIGLFPQTRNYKYRDNDPKLVSELHDFMELSFPQKVIGEPADWQSKRYFPEDKPS